MALLRSFMVFWVCGLPLGVWVVPLGLAHADEQATQYQVPAPVLTDLVDRPPTPQISVSPDNRTLLVLERPNLPPVAELAQPELGLAGVRIRPTTNGPSRASYLRRITIRTVTGQGDEIPLTGLPTDARIGSPRWAPDGQRFAFTVTGDDGVALFYAEVADGRARQLTGYRLNAAMGWPCDWRASSQSLFCKFVPLGRGSAPGAPMVPAGPVVQASAGAEAPNYTYQDLLKDGHDEALFEHYMSAEVALVNLRGARLWLGIRGLLTSVTPSPDGRFLLVERVQRPFSYVVPWWRFPRRVEVYGASGKRVAEIADLGLADKVPIAFGSVRAGRRIVGWRADAPATVYWVEAGDGGDIRTDAAVRDRVYLLPAPFTAAPTLLAEISQRYSGIRWGGDDVAVITDWMWHSRSRRMLLVNPAQPGAPARVLFDRSWEDRYSDPGSLVTRATASGTRVLVRAEDGGLLLFGRGASPEGDRPFIDHLTPSDGQLTRLWRSGGTWYERPIRWMGGARDGSAGPKIQVLTRRESPAEPPDYFLRQVSMSGPQGAAKPGVSKPGSASSPGHGLRRVTDFPHPHPELTGMRKELIRYRRGDGVALTATLYLPPGYEPGRDGPLPVILWAYPTEFKSADAAGQVTDSPYRFARVAWWSPVVWLLRGYAVLDNPTMPIVGEGKAEPNDTYIEQLVASAQAASDELVRRGVGDRNRIAIGGHSYGAFMTANLLAHSDLFRAGIARSGAYNRTLTPFGFQAEERSLWQASEVYVRMSPFMHAHRIDEPLLLIHGSADNNPGTYPVQSQRMYQAVQGLGGTVRLVMLPHESHGYRARESVLHMLWETDRWLETHVKKARPRAQAKSPRQPRARRR